MRNYLIIVGDEMKMEEIDTNKILKLIFQVDELMDLNLNSIKAFLSDTDLQKNCNDYEEHKSELLDIGFNIFTIVSELYYREKFHSQIIAALLNPMETHNEGNKFLDKFLSYLNKKYSEKCKISIDDYENAEVTGTKKIGEKSYIDIWIRGSKKCIIIENKINNASDQYRQIPTYVALAKNAGYEIDAIVYLSLDGKKQITDKCNWTQPEKEEIGKKLSEIAAFNNEDGKGKDLYHGWIIPCTNIANNIDALLILRQYGKIIKTLNITTMSNQIMKNFFEIILKENNFTTAIDIRDMVNDMPAFMANRLVDIFEPNMNSSPFKVIKAQGAVCMFREFSWQGSEIVIDIEIRNTNNYVVQFFDSSYYEYGGDNNRAFEILKQTDYFNIFKTTTDETKRDWYQISFRFPKQENDMIEFINLFNKKLLEFSDKNK
jgi:hypothetical protein